MIHELVYTSAEQGLQPQSSGYCTVAATPDIPRLLVQQLELLSSYRHAGDSVIHPVVYSYLNLQLGDERYWVLSRICDAGADFTGRTSFLAHHVALSESELAPAGPASLMARPDFFETQWNRPPCELDAARRLPQGLPPESPCAQWSRLTGDAGYAGLLAERIERGDLPITLVGRPDTPFLELVVELATLLDDPWKMPFSTHYTKLPPGILCDVRCVWTGSPQADLAARSGQSIFNLCLPQQPLQEEGRLIDLARNRGRTQTAAAAVSPVLPVAAPMGETGSDSLAAAIPIPAPVAVAAAVPPANVEEDPSAVAPPVEEPEVSVARPFQMVDTNRRAMGRRRNFASWPLIATVFVAALVIGAVVFDQVRKRREAAVKAGTSAAGPTSRRMEKNGGDDTGSAAQQPQAGHRLQGEANAANGSNPKDGKKPGSKKVGSTAGVNSGGPNLPSSPSAPPSLETLREHLGRATAEQLRAANEADRKALAGASLFKQHELLSKSLERWRETFRLDADQLKQLENYFQNHPDGESENDAQLADYFVALRERGELIRAMKEQYESSWSPFLTEIANDEQTIPLEPEPIELFRVRCLYGNASFRIDLRRADGGQLNLKQVPKDGWLLFDILDGERAVGEIGLPADGQVRAVFFRTKRDVACPPFQMRVWARKPFTGKQPEAGYYRDDPDRQIVFREEPPIRGVFRFDEAPLFSSLAPSSLLPEASSFRVQLSFPNLNAGQPLQVVTKPFPMALSTETAANGFRLETRMERVAEGIAIVCILYDREGEKALNVEQLQGKPAPQPPDRQSIFAGAIEKFEKLQPDAGRQFVQRTREALQDRLATMEKKEIPKRSRRGLVSNELNKRTFPRLPELENNLIVTGDDKKKILLWFDNRAYEVIAAERNFARYNGVNRFVQSPEVFGRLQVAEDRDGQTHWRTIARIAGKRTAVP